MFGGALTLLGLYGAIRPERLVAGGWMQRITPVAAARLLSPKGDPSGWVNLTRAASVGFVIAGLLVLLSLP